MASPASPLTVVLVGPEQPANIGFVARAMACYQLNDLRIVGSSGMAIAEAARKTAYAESAASILEHVRYFASLPEAIADCSRAFGFTRRPRDPSQAVLDLHAAVSLHSLNRGPEGISPYQNPVRADGSTAGQGGPPVALVFGRESQGLFRAETLAVTYLVRIPLPEETLSLNLSHAVAIALYAFTTTVDAAAHSIPRVEARASTTTGASTPERQRIPDLAENPLTVGETAQWIDHLLQALEGKGFLKGGKDAAQTEYVRLLWQRLNPNRRELDFLTGLLRSLDDSREEKHL